MSFELNLAVIPNHILYIKGVQLSYIKVLAHIFSLWHANSPCFLSNPELARRTQLHEDTVKAAIQFFEKNNILKREQKGKKRYLIEKTRYVEIENEVVDNSPVNVAKNDHGGEDRPPKGGKIDPPKGGKIDPHNIKTNTKYNKSSCSFDERSKNKELKQTAKFWEAGNPDYDRVNSNG